MHKEGILKCDKCACTSNDQERRVNFWEGLKGCIEALDDKGKILVLGYMNARVGDREVEGVVGICVVSKTNENGRKLRSCARNRF